MVVSLGGEHVKGLLPASNIGANTQQIIEEFVKASGFLDNSNTIQPKESEPVPVENSESLTNKLVKQWKRSGNKVLPPQGVTNTESYTVPPN